MENKAVYKVKANVAFDEGLRAYMISIYNYMFLAVLISAATAYLASTSSTFWGLMGTGFRYVVMFAPFVVVIFLSAKFHKMSRDTAVIMLMLFSMLMGLSLNGIFIMYTGAMITKAFLTTTALFGAMSIYGYSTKKDLTSLRTFLYMGLMGLIIASVINLFLWSSMIEFVLSIVTVIIFTGLTAYDTQRLKQIYVYYGGGSDKAQAAQVSKIAVYGALTLYMDFINMFLAVLRLTSGFSRR